MIAWVRAVGAAALVLAAVLSGCARIAPGDSIEERIESQWGTRDTQCPGDLSGEVGASIICRTSEGEASFDVKVTVTSVEGNTVNYSMERANTPGPEPQSPVYEPDDATIDLSAQVVDGDDVARSVFDQVAATVGARPERVSCPDLRAQVGESQRCTLFTGTDTYGVTVTVTGVQGSDVRFDIQVDRTPL